MNARVALVLIAALVGCTRHNKFFCNDPNNANDPECRLMDGSGSGSGSACGSDGDCSDPTPVCDTGMQKCVQCTAAEPAACMATTPICDADACRGCKTDDECTDSKFCNADGSCAASTDVLYVQAGASGDCSKQSPCDLLSTAAGMLSATISRIRMESGMYTEVQTASITVDAEIHGNNASIKGGAGDVISVTGAQVTIRDVVARGSGGAGVSCDSASKLVLLGFHALNNLDLGVSSTCQITMDRCLIQGNKGGGIQIIGGPYQVTNTIVLGNGIATSQVGGAQISSVDTTGNVFAGNTIAGNQNGNANISAGLECRNNTALQQLSTNIISGNVPALTEIREDANCVAVFCDSDVALADSSNTTVNPGLDATGHLMTGSMMIDKGDPALNLIPALAHDFDGDARPAHNLYDIGADEVP